MKKSFAIALSIMVLTGCMGKDKVDNKISTYFPFNLDNKQYVYTITDPISDTQQDITQTVFVTYLDNNKIQTRTTVGNLTTTGVYEDINGELKYTPVAMEYPYFENSLNTPKDTTFTELKEPLVEGTTWGDDKGLPQKITSMSTKVETKYATFDNAMEVTQTFVYGEGDTGTIKKYYAPNIGLVKEVTKTPEGEYVVQLSSVIENATLDVDATLYLPGDDKLEAKGATLKLKTNDNPAEKLLEQMKTENLVDKSAKLNIVEVNRKDVQNITMHVDFNNGFIDLTKLGAEAESLTIRGIVNTLGSFYGADKVKITVDGKDYSSGHIEMDEYFNVDK